MSGYRASSKSQLAQIVPLSTFANNVITSIQSPSPIVYCYGDSNTRYFLGDTGVSGEIQNAYSTYADVMSLQFNNISGADFVNKGNPGYTAQQGDTGFATNINNNPHVVVLGFGTNNIRISTNTLLDYITAMESMIQKTFALNAFPIILTIPDFHDAYADDGLVGKARLPVWNTALVNLANKYNVPIIDVYSMFNAERIDQHATFYNEASNWRHFSKYAQSIIAYKLCEILSNKSIFPSLRNEFKYSIDLEDEMILSTSGTPANYNVYLANGANNAHYNLNAIKLTGTDTSKITFRVAGDILTLGFYPRASAGICNIKITETRTGGVIVYDGTFDTYGVVVDNLYMPIKKFTHHLKKVLYDYTVEISSTNTKNENSTATDIYFVGLSAGKIYNI